MARPKAERPDPDVLRSLVSEGRLSVRVTPGARGESVAVEAGRVLVKVRAKPQNGAANDAVCRLVAQALGLATSRVRVSRGATSREKILAIDAG